MSTLIYDKLRAIYRKYGNKAVYPVIFFIFFIINLIGGFGLSYPATDPNELSVIAVSDHFIGRSWSGVMVSVDYYYGFLQGLVYTPIMLMFDDARVQYSAILFLNSVMISFVPVIAYYISYKLKTGKIWKCLIASFVTGGYCCYFAHTKSAWTETVSIVLPWILIWLTLRAGDCKNKYTRFLMSLLIGFTSGISFAAHTRLTAVVFALTLTLILERVFFGKKIVNFVWYFIALTLTTLAVIALSAEIQRDLWCAEDPSLLKNTLAEFFAGLPAAMENNGFFRFAETLSAQLYYFAASTWGLGAVSLCLFAAVMSSCIKHKCKKEAQTYEIEVSMFAFYSVFTVIFTLIFSTFYRFRNDNSAIYQDSMMFGRFTDGIVPLAMIFVLIMLFTHSISVNKILGAGVVLGIIYFSFIMLAVPIILSCHSTRIAPVLGLYPLRVGAASTELLTFDSLLLTMSMTFCIMGVLLVIISCTKRYRSIIISTIMSVVTVYSLIYISAAYLPICKAEAENLNESVVKLSESVYNQAGAPAVTAYKISRHDALMLQFLNRHISVKVTYDIESVPENSFLVVKAGEDVSALENSRTPFLLVGSSSTLRLYAYGERAAAYMRSQDIDEEELESEKETLIPEKTTAPAETSVPPKTTTTPPETSKTTERTPVVTTYVTPSVVTTPADSMGEDDNWAVIQ